ncbi:MAG TPA: efflux RND transporter periplasmic adaptor subunit, partial [Candidatus Moranbacteria bacterium]|nr:efflux RND transporter periplasmic adaptor subunit [Candidatus Moranbacteria bacterium]
MKSIRKKYFWIILFLLAAGTGYYLYSSANSESKEVRYVTARAQKGPMATSVSASGSIIVDQLVNVDPRISGTVYGLAVSVGDSVKKGQLLFMIDNDELSIDADRAYSSYLQAMASLENAKANKKEAKNVYEDSNSEEKKITKKKLDAAEISVEVAERNVKTSWKAHQNALKNASETRAVSTIDGTVIEINIENGDSLNDSSSGNGDKTPIIIGDLGTVKAEVQVNEVDISNVKVGQTATVAIDAIDGLSLTGKVEKIDALGTTNSGV